MRIYANCNQTVRRRNYSVHVDVTRLRTHTYATYLETDIKTIPLNVAIHVAQVSVDFQKSPSSDLIWCKTFRSDINLLMDIETVTSAPFYLPIVFD